MSELIYRRTGLNHGVNMNSCMLLFTFRIIDIKLYVSIYFCEFGFIVMEWRAFNWKISICIHLCMDGSTSAVQ